MSDTVQALAPLNAASSVNSRDNDWFVGLFYFDFGPLRLAF